MAPLYNKLSKEDALARLAVEQFSRTVLSFYRYVRIEDPQRMRDRLFREWTELGVLGRIYVAREGINAQMSVPEPQFEAFQKALNRHPELRDMYLNTALLHRKDAFYKLTIKVRNQIVADNLPEGSYDVSDVGNHLDARAFNNAMSDPNAVVVDMRNHYESRIGKFEDALTPDADTFREELPLVLDELADKKDKKILLYCTGGIRCEKASSFLKHHGFRDVNQLRGGVISYAHQVEKDGLENKFVGKNFTFDERLGERAGDDDVVISACDQCDSACDTYVNCQNEMCNLLFIQCATCATTMERCCSQSCLDTIHLPATEYNRKKEEFKKRAYTMQTYKKSVRPQARIAR
jgi:UPF0176 protein